MIILAHRGLWIQESEKNTLVAFQRAFELNYGIETDIREYKGELVISHDIADDECLKFKDFLELYKSYGGNLVLALNIKADGLQKELKKYLEDYKVTNYFVFDMSVPEQIVFKNDKFNVFTRESELEKDLILYGCCQGVWMDEFNEQWISKERIKWHLDNNKKVGIISSEIHKNDYKLLWEILKEFSHDQIMLCTDIPEKAEVYFNE